MKPNDTQRLVQALDRKLDHILEASMRRAVVLETLVSKSPKTTAALLQEVFERLPQHGTTFDTLRDTIFEVLRADETTPTGHLSYEARKAIYEAADECGAEEVMRVLRSTHAIQDELEKASKKLPLEISEIPLGQRRSLAKGGEAALLEKLAQDFDPMVIRNILRNLHTKELDVIRIASMRPVHESTLNEIHESQRWSSSVRVRMALAQNPYCPIEIAMQIIPSLPLPELRELRQASHLHSDTRESIDKEYQRRK
jgi:hypothetical protein